MRLASQIAALCLAAIAGPAWPRDFTTQDLLSAEEFGEAAFTPDGRLLVFERLIPFEASGPFEYDTYPPLRRGRIYVQEVGSASPPRQLLQTGPAEGHTAGPISPSGQARVVLRLTGRDWEAGVVSLASGKVCWLGIIPELAQLGKTIAWRSDNELVIAARADIPLRLRAGWQARETLQAFWNAASQGKPALTETGPAPYGGAASKTPAGRLVVADLARRETRTLALGDFYDLEVSPDGSKVAAMAQYEALPIAPDPRVVATPNRRRNLVVADLFSSETATPCPACDLTPHLIAWSPNSQEVLVHGRREVGMQAELLRLSSGEVRGVNIGRGELVLDATSEGHRIPRASWLKDAPIALLKDQRADWWRLDGAAPSNLTAALPAPPAARLLANDGEAIFAASGRTIWRVDLEGARPVAMGGALPPQGFWLSSRERQSLPPKAGWYMVAKATGALASTAGEAAPSSGAVAPLAVSNGVSAVVQASSFGGLELVLADPSARTVMALNASFADIDFAQVRSIPAPGTAGLQHHLLMPPKPLREPPPLVVVPYPGLAAYPPPRPYGGNGRFPVNAHLMAAAGYAVLLPALPRKPELEPSQDIAAQILEAVDVVAEGIGGIDARRPILWGHSFGGYSALMAASQSNRFAAVIASAAPSNLSSVRGVFDVHGEALPQDGLSAYVLGWSEAGQANLRASPWQDPALYVRNSPVFQAGSITAPVLLIHGDIDFVRLSQAQEMFTALARQSKDVTLLTAHGDGHVVSTPGNLMGVYARAFDWLRERVPPPDPASAK